MKHSDTSVHTGQQMLLPLDLPADSSIGSFQVSESNRAVVQMVQTGLAATGGLPLMMVHGEAACGKSHLGRALVERFADGGLMMPAVELTAGLTVELNAATATGAKLLVLDTLEAVQFRREQQTLITELINQRRQDGQGKILLLSRLSPSDWSAGKVMPDFASRLVGCGHIAEILPPDDALLRALLHKQAADCQFFLPENVVEYCLARMPRQFAAVQAFIGLLDTLSLEQQRRVTLATARLALECLFD